MSDLNREFRRVEGLVKAWLHGGKPISSADAKVLLEYISHRDEIISELSEQNMLRGIEISELERAITEGQRSDRLKAATDSRGFSTRRLRKLLNRSNG